MTIYHTFLDDSTVSGLETVQGIQNDGSEFGVGISSNIVCNNLNATGIITSTDGISNGTNTLSFSVLGSNLTLTVAGVGSTVLKLS